MLFSHDLHIVFIYTALVMFICAFDLPFESTTPFCPPPLFFGGGGGVANALGNSDFARFCSWNLAIFSLYCYIALSIKHN